MTFQTAERQLPSTAVCASQTSSQRVISNFIAEDSFPCVGAKSALNRGRMRFAEFSALGHAEDAQMLCESLRQFSADFPDPGGSPVSFVASFKQPIDNEIEFEKALWAQLQLMSDIDSKEFAWDRSVGSDAEMADFSMSVAGRAFFVVGLHPNASRLARRAPMPCLVFNFHDQFESLRTSGKYETMQVAIRARDEKLQGFINPVLARFGESSEARQYSGRAVSDDWKCPFHRQAAGHA